VDQAIGVLIAIHRLTSAGFEVLREVSPLPEPVGRQLDAAVQRRSHQQGASDAEAG
jgi:hypothetical protein